MRKRGRRVVAGGCWVCLAQRREYREDEEESDELMVMAGGGDGGDEGGDVVGCSWRHVDVREE